MEPPSFTGLMLSSKTQNTRYTMIDAMLIQKRFLKASEVEKSKKEYYWTPVIK